MTVGIVGLGLIGGSMAKAYKAGGQTVFAYDLDSSVTDMAMMQDVVDEELSTENIGKCELILIALYPQDTVAWLSQNAPHISRETVVMDLCGIKRYVCERCFPIAEEYGFTYAGGHPMAGIQQSGYKYANAGMFTGASMIVVPPRFDDIELLEKIKTLLAPANFRRMTVTTAAEHDRMIAFTSQMAHVVSNAFIKSPTAGSHRGFSAGSYKDLTRVAYLNETMWTELFLENRDNLMQELDFLIDALQDYRAAIQEEDEDRLRALLLEGKLRKKSVDG